MHNRYVIYAVSKKYFTFYEYFRQAGAKRTITSAKYRPLETFGDVFLSEIRYCMLLIVFDKE
jgi:hypothetical protein